MKYMSAFDHKVMKLTDVDELTRITNATPRNCR